MMSQWQNVLPRMNGSNKTLWNNFAFQVDVYFNLFTVPNFVIRYLTVMSTNDHPEKRFIWGLNGDIAEFS